MEERNLILEEIERIIKNRKKSGWESDYIYLEIRLKNYQFDKYISNLDENYLNKINKKIKLIITLENIGFNIDSGYEDSGYDLNFTGKISKYIDEICITNSNISKLSIKNLFFNGKLKLRSISLIKFMIENSYINDLEINKLIFIELEELGYANDLYLRKNIINNLRIFSNKTIHINIIKNFISNFSLSGELNFISSFSNNFGKLVEIGSLLSDTFHFVGNYYKKSKIYNSSIDLLDIANNNISNIELRENKLNKLDIIFLGNYKNFIKNTVIFLESNEIKKNYIYAFNKFNLNLSIDLIISDITLKNGVNIYLQDLSIKKIILNNIFTENFGIKLNNLNIENFKIENSNLGKSIISNTKINNLELKNPVLNETIFNNVEFPKTDIKIAGEENSTNYSEVKEYYIQLKNVMDNSGNHIQADKFFAKEMEYYGKSLKGEKGQFWNKLVYYIQKGISDFGNDWTLPILWMINLGNLNIIFKEKYYFTLFYILIFGFFYYISHKSFLVFKEESNFKKIIKNILMVFIAFLLFNIFYYFYYKISLYIIFENSIEILNYLDTFANAIKPLDVLNVTSDITFFGLLYKITLAILIYHLIISLKRLTKR